MRVVEQCSDCGLTTYSSYSSGVHIDTKHWDGSDFFLTDEVPGIFVSERAADIIQKNSLKVCALTPSDKMS